MVYVFFQFQLGEWFGKHLVYAWYTKNYNWLTENVWSDFNYSSICAFSLWWEYPENFDVCFSDGLIE